MPRWPPRPTIRQAFLAVLCLVVCLMVAGVLVYQGNSRPRFHRPTLLQAKVYAGENIVFPESQVLGSQNADSGSKTRDSGSQGSPDNAEQAMVLMSQYKPTHKGPTVDPSLLEGHISLLVKSMMSNKTMLDKLPTAPQCVGEEEGEVEDILCRPRPKFIPEVKNPCWYVKVKAKRGSNKKKRKLRCLPYFHILGVPKSATTDLWNRMMYHPHLVPNGGLLHKEALWWSWQRYGMVGYNQHRRVKTFKDYVDLFNTTAWQVKLSLQMNDEHHKNLITGDASPPDFWDFRGWRNISQNRGLSWPRVITPHLMAHFYATPRFILMFRDPVERMYSDYFFVGGGLTTLDFHNDVKATIHMLASCVRILGMQRCFYDSSLYNKLPVRLPFACYSVYLREWLGVFPVDNFLFLHNEDYAADPVKTIKEVFAFLDLAPLEQSDYDKILDEERSRVTVEKSKAGEMMGETRDILHRLLDPCTAELKRMTQTT